jgi:CHAT domain-containing protein
MIHYMRLVAGSGFVRSGLSRPRRRHLFPGRALLICTALVACTPPPPEAHVAGGRQDSLALDVGMNSVRQPCALQTGKVESQIYCGTADDPSGRVVSMPATGELDTFLTVSAWRTALDRRLRCEAPVPITVLDHPAARLSCARLSGNWPHLVVATRRGETFYVADGGKNLEPVLGQAIGVVAGAVPAVPFAAPNAEELKARRDIAQSVAGDSGDPERDVERLARTGARENHSGNYAAAEQAYRAAVARKKAALGSPRDPGLAILLAHQALQVSNQGRYGEADRLFARAETLAGAPGQADPVAKPLVTQMRALDKINHGQMEDALRLLDLAASGFSAPDVMPPEAIAPPPRSRGGTDLMIRNAELATLATPSVSDALNGLTETRRYRALVLFALKRDSEAKATLSSAEDLFGNRDPKLRARYDRTIGWAEAMAGQNADAVSRLGRAVSTFSIVQADSRPLAETQLLLAAQLVAQNDLAAALPFCRAASRTLQLEKAGVSGALVVPCLDALASLISQPKADAAAAKTEMFVLSQLAQGGITSQQIARAAARLGEGSGNPRAAEAIQKRDAANNRLETLYRRRAGIAGDKDRAADLARLDEEIRQARDEKADAGAALMEAAPKFDSLVQGSAGDTEAQALLRPNEALVSIVLGNKSGWTILLRGDSIDVGRIPLGTAEINGLVADFRKTVTVGADHVPPPFAVDASRKLYDAVLGPVDGGLKDVNALNVAPVGSLLSIPFGALLTGDAQPGDLGKAPFLIRRMSVSHVPSVGNFVSLRKTASVASAARPWFGLGDPRPPTAAQAKRSFPVETCGSTAQALEMLKQLPGARRELEGARTLLNARPGEELVGPGFTADAVLKADLRDFRLLHFATHALLPDELRCQEEPALLTSTAADAADANGALLRASDIERMDLDADLVILSACNTGGSNGGAAESLSGLARSFFFAGARGLMVTHWEANDITTPLLTGLFLGSLKNHPQAGPAAALADAQRQILDRATGSLAALGHPYYWAIEALIGGASPAPASAPASASLHPKTDG